jgi:hypothetical protein
MGPVLNFRGADEGRWRLSALVAAEAEPPALAAEGLRAAPLPLAERRGRALWRYDFSLPLGEAPTVQDYAIGGRSWRVALPARARGGLRMAYTACNGTEDGGAGAPSSARNERWLHLASEHARKPFHLLLQGGDQLYADEIWHEVPALSEWRGKAWRRRRGMAPSSAMEDGIRGYYFDAYLRLWAQPELAPLLASIPSLMMWDDHDIIDGWGSHPEDRHGSPVHQMIWSAAREGFALFQLAAPPGDLPEGFGDRRGGHFGWAHRVGEVGVLAPDLRSGRDRRRVMDEAAWRAFLASLEGMADCRHVLLLSSVPLVNVQLDRLERLFSLVPGQQEWQDDLIDQWPSLAHRGEWIRMLRALLRFSAERRVPVTSLSGEIHLGSLGIIEGEGTRIHQLTSSGVVHPPPPAWAVAALERAAKAPLEAAPGVDVRLLPLPGLEPRRFLRARNWLELEIAPDGGLLATWHGEGGASTTQLHIPGEGKGR